jgi:hypothetical protein
MRYKDNISERYRCVEKEIGLSSIRDLFYYYLGLAYY